VDTPPDIRLRGLVKRYGDLAAVDGIDLDVQRGEFLHVPRPVGLGQDDDAAADRRVRASRRRRRRAGRHRRLQPAAVRS
jgi:hypothetical protein